MKISTFEEDLFELKDFALRLERFIAVENDFVEGSLVVALTSKYGSGKTTFLEMWKSYLRSQGETTENPLVISLNAWESDYYGDPLFAIVLALIESLKEKGESVNSLVGAAKDLGWFATAIGGQVFNKVTGIDTLAAGELAGKKKVKREEAAQTIPDSFSIYKDRKEAMQALKNEIESFVSASEPRVIFLVDELDRCRPDYAITYLETIKHIFDVKGAVFLLAADRRQLENSAKTAFGSNLDFEEYYRKFIHREVMLPKISESGYKRLASKYVAYYLEREGKRYCFMQFDYHQINNISEIISALKLTPRQIQDVFRILGHLFSTAEERKGSLLWCLGVGSVIMATLKVGDPHMFDLIGSQKLECEDAVQYLKKLLGDDVEWWFLLLLTGGGILKKDGETTEDLIKRAGFTNENGDISIHADLRQLSHAWGFSGSDRFSEICEKIEQISQWK